MRQFHSSVQVRWVICQETGRLTTRSTGMTAPLRCALADDMANAAARVMLLDLADDYDKLGDGAADRQVNVAKQATPD